MRKLYAVAIFFLLCAAGCAGPGLLAPSPATAVSSPAITAAPALEPYWPTQGWRTSTPEQQGISSKQLAQMLDAIAEKKLNIHSILIVRHGYLVAEVYYGSNTPSLKHELYSVTKSFTSALVGIALGKGFIDSVNHPVLGFFPDRQAANLDTRKKAMTLEHLLTMSSGLDWPESSSSYSSPNNRYLSMMRTSDWLSSSWIAPWRKLLARRSTITVEARTCFRQLSRKRRG